ncbi:peptidoglycan editing factor PgeF [Cerasibacillus terrae]|uniref:Purine nucleoside phosphorylase n=1 Tax=Cerasibacillus terrae TaxID=2498845 RepID=A0A5C8P344_9BACI|nr:peptidoglycan editing factor PgeF [Cerasibacillus terrae]TXL67606.1 peptidoglycan editing factor PgeF [Cerasibacillus terrae]
MSDAFKLTNPSTLHIKQWEQKESNLITGFTTKNEGVSTASFASLNMGLHVSDDLNSVLENRQILAKHIRFPLNNWVQGEQIHDAVIQVIDKDDRGFGSNSSETALKGIDGLITNQQGVLCTAVFADCVPLYFFDPVTKYIGIAHAGWKGTVRQIAKKMVEKLVELGVNPHDLLVAIGPCISREKYKVDKRVINHIPIEYQSKTVFPQKNGQYLLDLKQLNVEIFLHCGVLRTNIVVTKYCTYSHSDLFFSHRRDQGKTGRMLGFIGYQP